MPVALCLSIKSVGQTSANNADALFRTLNDRQFVPLKKVQYETGSPYWADKWQNAKIKTAEGGVSSLMPVKLNLLDQELLYKNNDGTEMVAIQPLQSVSFMAENGDTSNTFVTKLAFKENAPQFPNGWMELLANGEACLLKKHHKEENEMKMYGSNEIQKSIQTSTQYLLWHKGRLSKIASAEELASLLNISPATATGSFKNKADKKEAAIIQTVLNYNTRH